MKRLVFFIMLLPVLCSAQMYTRAQVKNLAITGGLFYLYGVSKGYSDVLSFRYQNFKTIHPNANDQFWNPDISWTNKYKNGDPALGPAFFGSTTVFVWTTDAPHLIPSAGKVCLIGAVVLKIGEKKKFKQYAIESVYYSLCASAGFWTIYEIRYR